MSIKFENLPYATNALEPYVSQRTMEIHYEKHYKKYVSNVNRLTLGSRFDVLNLESLMLETSDDETDIFNNAAQAWNHAFFWNCLTPRKTTPSNILLSTLKEQFGSVEEFKEKFLYEASRLFGSGWVWLVKESGGKLSIKALGNAGNPISQGQVPLLVCDVWEHAYYLDYQNDRGAYLSNFWSIVNWDFVEANLAKEVPRQQRARRRRGDLTTAAEFEKARESHH